MTAGLPGAGIGGMFYMLSAIAMPFNAAYRSIRAKVTGRAANPPVQWKPVIRQFSIAAGILGALWLTGWLIAFAINSYPHALGAMNPAAPGHRVPNILKTGALVLSVGTLVLVLVAVQVARLFIRKSPVQTSRRVSMFILLLMIAAPALIAQDGAVDEAHHLASTGHTDQAIALLESWTVSHPDDVEALRYLGDQRRRAGRFREAAEAYRAAQDIAPKQQIATRLELAEANVAPAIEISTNGSADSDENRTYGVSGAGSVAVGNRARFGVGGGWKQLTGIFSANVANAFASLYARPLATLRFEGSGGAMFTNSDIAGTSGETIGVGSARLNWKHPGGAVLDLRASRSLLDASGELVLNRVVRNEIAGRADIPLISRVKFRGGAKAAKYDAVNESSTRTVLSTGLAAQVTDAAEVSGMFQELRFDHATTSGYFAPRLAQLAELGTYAEFESESGSVLAVDAGAGAQRVVPFSVATADWKPALRLFAQLTVPVRPGSELRAEVDSYNSAFGNAAVSSTNWRYISGSLSLRLALR